MIVDNRWLGLPFAVVGTACVIAGGILAAATANVSTEHTAWATAYLVLVCGVGQIVLGVAAGLPNGPTRGWAVLAVFIGWNLANAAVLAGTLLGTEILVDFGGVLLALVLVEELIVVHKSRSPVPWLLPIFRSVVAIMLVSIPIGLLLAHH